MTDLVNPTNKIVERGDPQKTEMEIETVANCYPGRLVQKGTTDDEVVVGADETPFIGVLGYEHATPEYQPATVDTIYKVNDRAPVLFGGNFTFKGRLANGQTVLKGQMLGPAANGELKKWQTGDTLAMIKAMESVDASGGAADVLCKFGD